VRVVALSFLNLNFTLTLLYLLILNHLWGRVLTTPEFFELLFLGDFVFRYRIQKEIYFHRILSFS